MLAAHEEVLRHLAFEHPLALAPACNIEAVCRGRAHCRHVRRHGDKCGTTQQFGATSDVLITGIGRRHLRAGYEAEQFHACLRRFEDEGQDVRAWEPPIKGPKSLGSRRVFAYPLSVSLSTCFPGQTRDAALGRIVMTKACQRRLRL